MQNWSERYRCENPGKKIGFVPTMGFLHQGHLSLIKEARKSCDVVVVSIFVNPIQFNNREDLANYPRDINRDINLLQEPLHKLNVDILFNPDSGAVYENGFPELFMDYPKLTDKLCGKTRPGHFSGVLIIVHNLFMWVKPHAAVFGLKDYQQYILIKKMTQDLQMKVEIIPGKLLRENDGLAMSSRNVRLSPDERSTALVISKTLFKIKEEFAAGKHLLEKSQSRYFKDLLAQGLTGLNIDYASLYNAETLDELADSDSPENALVAVAVFIGNVRLIDNILLP